MKKVKISLAQKNEFLAELPRGVSELERRPPSRGWVDYDGRPFTAPYAGTVEIGEIRVTIELLDLRALPLGDTPNGSEPERGWGGA